MFVSVFFGFSVVLTKAIKPCADEDSIDISDGFKTASGTIIRDNVTFSKDLYFLVDNDIKGCICKVKFCVRKCCGYGQIYDSNNRCIKSSHDFYVPLHYKNKEIRNLTSDYFVLPGLHCSDFVLKIAYENISIQNDRTLHLFGEEGLQIFPPRQYCVDYFERDGHLTFGSKLCDAEPSEDPDLNTICIFISIPFLLVTLVVYLSLPEKRNINGKCFMCYVFSLMMGDIFLVTSVYEENLELSCIPVGACCWFFYMASFFWVNVISFDIWWTFRRIKKISSKKSQQKRFLIYCAYAWGVPTFCLILLLVFKDYKPYGAQISQNNWCWIEEGYPVLVNFYGPMGLLIIINIILFALTVMKIKNVTRETSMLQQDGSKKHTNDNRKNYYLYLKLLLAMGLNWIAELISWFTKWKYSHLRFIWYITDLCNAFYGIFIFFMFVYKKKTWRSLKRRYHSITGRTTSSKPDRIMKITMNILDSDSRVSPKQ